MKKRHILKIICLVLFLIIPWIVITFPQYFKIKNVKKHTDNFTIIDVTITEVAHVSPKIEETYIQFEYNGENYIDYVELDAFDYFRNTTKIAINKESGEIIRMQIAIPLWQWASLLMAFGCLLKEQEEYKKQIEKREKRLKIAHKKD